MSQSPIPIVRVTEWELRKMFNDGRYWERVQSGELFYVTIHEGTPTPDKNQPPGTKTIMVAIRETLNGPDLAHAHGFIQPGWVIGAKGRLDPKRIWKDGKLYRIVYDKNRPVTPPQF
jgi:hypothetical protein